MTERIAQPATPTAGLDERVLDAGTTQRFVLLLVLFAGESTATSFDFVSRIAQAFGGTAPTWVSYVGLVLLVAATIAVYVRRPRWQARGTIPLADYEDGGRLRAALDELSGLARRKPAFVIDPAASSAGALVFGTGIRPKVRLNGGLVVTRTTEPDRFRTVVLHELAHVDNSDVGLTYATEAMWRVLLIGALLPDVLLILVTRFTGGTTLDASALARALAIVALVYLTRADILRRRELYADRTAARWHSHELPTDPPARVPFGARFGELWRTHPSWRLRQRSLTEPDELFATRALTMVSTGIAAEIAAVQLTSPFGAAGNSWLAAVQYLLISGLVVGIGGVALWRASVHAVLTGRHIPSGWRAGLWLGLGLALGQLTNGPPPTQPEVFLVLIAVVGVLLAWTGQFAELRIRTYQGESLNVAMVVGLVAPGLVLAFALLWWNKGDWLTGWHYSITGALAHAKLPSAHAPALLRLTATLTFLPGSDLGFSGLWWSVPLLWLVPLQLWLLRLPRAAPGWLPKVRELLLRRKQVRGPLRSLLGLGTLVAGFAGLFLLLLLLSDGPVGYITLAAPVWLGCVLLWRTRRQSVTAYWLDHAQPGSAPPAMDAPELRWVVRIGLLGGLASWLGLLAEPLVATSGSSATDVDLAWVVVVITVVMAVVAGVTAVLARGRYPLITGLIAAGSTAITGLIGEFLKGAVDGCLGPLHSLTTTCDVQPLHYLPLAEYAMGYVLGPALLLAGLVATACSLLVRRTAPDETGPRQLARPMLLTGFLNAVAVTSVVAVTAFQSIVMVAPIPTEDLLFEYAIPTTASAPTGISLLANWAFYVGDTLTSYGHALSGLADMGRKFTDDITTDRRIKDKAAPPICAVLTDMAQHGDENARQIDPEVPDVGDRLWVAFLAPVDATARDCVELEQATTEREIVASFQAIDTDSRAALDKAQALSSWLSTQH